MSPRPPAARVWVQAVSLVCPQCGEPQPVIMGMESTLFVERDVAGSHWLPYQSRVCVSCKAEYTVPLLLQNIWDRPATRRGS